jgi:hypothetical protein
MAAAVFVLTSIFWLAVLGRSKSVPQEDIAPLDTYNTPLAYYHTNTPPDNKAGRSIAWMSEDELRTMLYSANFRDLDGMSLNMMRRLFLAWHYKALYERVAKKTGLQEPVIFAYFIIEATIEGSESTLWAEHWNPGGIKYRGRAKMVMAKDDCGPVPCAFESFSSFDQAVHYWAEVFNSERYKDCKRRQIDDTCECLKKAGYYTGKGWKNRAAIAHQYVEFIANNFPNNV